MERYIDGLDASARYKEIVEEFRDGDLGNFVGSYCGHPVFSGSQEIFIQHQVRLLDILMTYR